MGITESSVKRPIATTMIYLIVVVLGIVGLRYLPIDLLPPIEFPRLSIIVDYPNVGPEEIETIITDQIENAVAGVSNVEEVTSSSEEGRSRVSLSFSHNTKLDEGANDLSAVQDRERSRLSDNAESHIVDLTN